MVILTDSVTVSYFNVNLENLEAHQDKTQADNDFLIYLVSTIEILHKCSMYSMYETTTQCVNLLGLDDGKYYQAIMCWLTSGYLLPLI